MGHNSTPLSDVKVLDLSRVLARQMVVDLLHPKIGSIKMSPCPIKMSETPCEIARHPPLLGEHTEEILKEYLDYSAEDIEELRKNGMI
jgi:crotonobetainyl-CoA:carnitine CoA-transferase CaiB-like acyl-CoA transferase